MFEIAVDVPSKDHSRLCYDVAQIAKESNAEIEAYKFTTRANAKSILSLYALGIKSGDKLYIKTEDESVLHKIGKLFN